MRDGDWKLPPKKRNWKKGQTQIGLFIRSKDGSVVEMINDAAPQDMINAALKLGAAMAGKGTGQ